MYVEEEEPLDFGEDDADVISLGVGGASGDAGNEQEQGDDREHVSGAGQSADGNATGHGDGNGDGVRAELPSSSALPQAAAAAAPSSVPVDPLAESSAAAPLQRSPSPLPTGWERVKSSSGDVYFYHSQTGHCTWERPVEHSQTLQSNGNSDEGRSRGEVHVGAAQGQTDVGTHRTDLSTASGTATTTMSNGAPVSAQSQKRKVSQVDHAEQRQRTQNFTPATKDDTTGAKDQPSAQKRRRENEEPLSFSRGGSGAGSRRFEETRIGGAWTSSIGTESGRSGTNASDTIASAYASRRRIQEPTVDTPPRHRHEILPPPSSVPSFDARSQGGAPPPPPQQYQQQGRSAPPRGPQLQDMQVPLGRQRAWGQPRESVGENPGLAPALATAPAPAPAPSRMEREERGRERDVIRSLPSRDGSHTYGRAADGREAMPSDPTTRRRQDVDEPSEQPNRWPPRGPRGSEPLQHPAQGGEERPQRGLPPHLALMEKRLGEGEREGRRNAPLPHRGAPTGVSHAYPQASGTSTPRSGMEEEVRRGASRQSDRITDSAPIPTPIPPTRQERDLPPRQDERSAEPRAQRNSDRAQRAIEELEARLAPRSERRGNEGDDRWTPAMEREGQRERRGEEPRRDGMRDRSWGENERVDLRREGHSNRDEREAGRGVEDRSSARRTEERPMRSWGTPRTPAATAAATAPPIMKEERSAKQGATEIPSSPVIKKEEERSRWSSEQTQPEKPQPQPQRTDVIASRPIESVKSAEPLPAPSGIIEPSSDDPDKIKPSSPSVPQRPRNRDMPSLGLRIRGRGAANAPALTQAEESRSLSDRLAPRGDEVRDTHGNGNGVKIGTSSGSAIVQPDHQISTQGQSSAPRQPSSVRPTSAHSASPTPPVHPDRLRHISPPSNTSNVSPIPVRELLPSNGSAVQGGRNPNVSDGSPNPPTGPRGHQRRLRGGPPSGPASFRTQIDAPSGPQGLGQMPMNGGYNAANNARGGMGLKIRATGANTAPPGESRRWGGGNDGGGDGWGRNEEAGGPNDRAEDGRSERGWAQGQGQGRSQHPHHQQQQRQPEVPPPLSHDERMELERLRRLVGRR